MRSRRGNDQETILPPIDLSRLRRGRKHRGAARGPADGRLADLLPRVLLFWLSPWLFRAGAAAVVAAVIWFWVPNATTLARLVGTGLSTPSIVTDWLESSRARLNDLANSGLNQLGTLDGQQDSPAEVAPLVVQATEEATTR